MLVMARVKYFGVVVSVGGGLLFALAACSGGDDDAAGSGGASGAGAASAGGGTGGGAGSAGASGGGGSGAVGGVSGSGGAGGAGTGGTGAGIVPPSWADCLARSAATTTVITGTQSLFKQKSPPADWNLDLTAALFDGYPDQTTSPVNVGSTTPAVRACIGGGIVKGQQALDLTWLDMHDTIGGGGYRINTAPGEWTRIDGIRVHNVEDALKPRGQDGYWELWNAYMTYIRDDCIENDETAPGSVHDSLFDGCYTGFSEQLQSGCCDAEPGEVFVVERSLMRLQPMPGPYGTPDPKVLGHGKFFKWVTPVPHPVVISDSIFLSEGMPSSTSTNWPFPPGTKTTNVTIVWDGPVPWTWPVPPGTTVTTDKSVWDKARQRWLDRHGCTSFDNCSKLTNPDPWP